MLDSERSGGVPEHTLGTIKRYVENRYDPGSFMRAVLENNLKEACLCADDLNRLALFSIVSYCYNEIPSNCWGSPEVVEAWLNGSDEPEDEVA